MPKVDGRSFVTGGHNMPPTSGFPACWYGKVLRPPSFGATLASVDLERAPRSMPDVVVVHDGDFVGVAAPSSSLATRALAAIKAEWKPGPRLSGKDLFENLKRQGTPGGAAAATAPARQPARSPRARESADIHLEQTYTIAYIAHAPLEPRAAVADGRTAS